MLPPAQRRRVSVEAGVTFGWREYVGDRGVAIGIDRYGASAPGEVVLEKLGITPAARRRRGEADARGFVTAAPAPAPAPGSAAARAPRTELARTLAVVALGLGIVALYAFPGYMAYDSFDQLEQARAGTLTDWHPPLMSAIWGVLDRAVPGPLAMLVLQCGLFLAGLFVLLRRRMSPRRAAVLTLVLFAFPPNLTMLAVVLKDSLMCGALLAGCAALTSEDRRWRLASLPLFALAAGLRYNAVAVVVPLLAWLSPWPRARPGGAPAGPLLRAAAGALIGLAVTAAAWGCNRALTDVETHPFHVSVAPMDYVGTLHFAGPLTDDEVRALLAGVPLGPARDLQAHAHALYDPLRWWGGLIRGPERLFDEPLTPEARAAVTAGWWRLVREHPGAYLASRADMFRELIGLTDSKFTPVYAAGHERGMLRAISQPERPRNVVQRWLGRRMTKLGATSLIFRPYVYLVLALALGIVLRRDRLVVALIASAFANLALLFVASPSPDIRYVHWAMVIAMIGLAIRLFGARPAPAAAATS